MITAKQAWREFMDANDRRREALAHFLELHEATAVRHMALTYTRTGERITLKQAKAQVEAMMTPVGFSAVYNAWESYKNWREETKVAKDVWQAVRDHDRQISYVDEGV